MDKVAGSGPGLAFTAYPEALSLLPLPQFWRAIFFITVIFLGFDSQVRETFTKMTSNLVSNEFIYDSTLFFRFNQSLYLDFLKINKKIHNPATNKFDKTV